MRPLLRIYFKICFSKSTSTWRRSETLGGWRVGFIKLPAIPSLIPIRSTRPTTTLEAAEVLNLPEELPDDDVVSEQLPCIRAMVRNLPELDRQALVLTEYQGLTQKEMAERLGLSFSGAKSRVQRAREKLKQQLLECCHFELDRRGHIIDYQARCHSCETAACCSDELLMPTRSRPDASFLQPLRLSEQNKAQ